MAAAVAAAIAALLPIAESDVTNLVADLAAKLDDSQAGAFGLTILSSANAADAKLALGYTAGDISGLGYFATGTDAANLTGTVAAARIADASLSIAKTSGLQAALDTMLELVPGAGGWAGYFLTADDIGGGVAFHNPTTDVYAGVFVDQNVGYFYGQNSAATQYLAVGGSLNAHSRFPIDGSHAFEFTVAPFVGTNVIYHAGNLNQSAYRTLLDSSGSHTTGKVAGTYGMGQGDPLAVTGTGTLYPLNLIYIDAADYPASGALAAKLRVRCIVECNDVAPTGNFTIGLHPVTRPAASGGAGLCTYTIGAAVAGSTVAVNTPAADSQNIATGADFAVPATGFYVIGVVTTATVAASAHMHLSAQLQMRHI